MIRIVNISDQLGTAREGVGRAFAYSASRPSAFGRLLAMLFLIVMGAVALILIIPLVLVAMAAGLAYFAWLRVRSGFTRAQQPNGALDGRRNVRVRMPDQG